MRSLVKWLIGIVLFISVVVLAAGYWVTHHIDPNTYKSKITTSFHQHTGLTLKLQGPIHWQWFPGLRLVLNDVSVAGLPELPSKKLMSIKSATVHLSLLPLLRKKIVVPEVDINQMQLNLVRSHHMNTWQLIQRQHPSSSAPPSGVGSSTATGATSSGSGSMAIDIDKVIVTDSSLNYYNLDNKTSYSLRDFHFSGKGIAWDKAFPLSLGFSFGSSTSDWKTKVQMDSRFHLDPDQETYQLLGLKLNVDAQHKGAQQHLLCQLDGKAHFNLKRDTGSVQSTLTVNQLLRADLTANLQHLSSAPTFDAALNVSPFDFVKWRRSIGMPMQPLPNPQALKDVSLSSQFVGSLKALEMNKLRVRWGKSELQGHFKTTLLQPKMTFSFGVNQIELADFMTLHGARFPLQRMTFFGGLSARSWGEPGFSQSLSGSLDFSVNNATLYGIDVGKTLNQVTGALNKVAHSHGLAEILTSLKGALPDIKKSQGKKVAINPDNGQKTNFGKIVMHSSISSGMVHTDKLYTVSPDFHVSGSGQINLKQNKAMDYLILLGRSSQRSATAQQSSEDSAAVQLPIRIQGTLNNPKAGVDWPLLLKQIKRISAQSARKQFQKNIKKNAGKWLKGLFK